MKAYTTKSNARRAAKSAGLEQFEIIEVEGGFAFQAIAQEEAAPVVEAPVVGEFVNCPHCGIHVIYAAIREKNAQKVIVEK